MKLSGEYWNSDLGRRHLVGAGRVTRRAPLTAMSTMPAGRGRTRRGAAGSRSSCRDGRSRAGRRGSPRRCASISSSRACVSTWIVTSSGIRSCFDELAHEVEIGLRGGREADLDLLEAHAHQQVEHAALALGPHRLDQRLVAVAQIDAAPDRRALDDAGRPLSVGQVDRLERPVFVDRASSSSVGSSSLGRKKAQAQAGREPAESRSAAAAKSRAQRATRGRQRCGFGGRMGHGRFS